MTETTGRPDAADMAEIIRECCARFRPDLTSPVTETLGAAQFSVTSSLTGRRFRVTVTEEGLPS